MFKERLLEAVRSAVESYNGGASDVDAVVKSAEKFDFNMDQTRRLAESYNTAKTVCFLKNAEDRTGAFTTVDADDVLSARFSTKEPSKAGKVAEFYSKVPTRKKQEHHDIFDLWRVKAAEETVVTDNTLRNELLGAEDLKKSAEHATNTAGILEEMYDRNVHGLAKELRRNMWADQDICKKAASCFRATDERSAEIVMRDIAVYMPSFEKDAENPPELSDFDSVRPDLFDLFKEASRSLVEIASLRGVAETFRKEASSVFASVEHTSGKNEEYDEMTGLFTEDMNKLAAVDKPISMPGSEFGTMPMFALQGAMSGMREGVGTEFRDSAIDAMKGSDQLDLQKAKDDNVDRGLILTEIVATDPELKGYDPDAVLQKYKYIVKNYPEFSLDRQALPGLLKSMLESQTISPYDAVQLMQYGEEKYKQKLLQKPRTKVTLAGKV